MIVRSSVAAFTLTGLGLGLGLAIQTSKRAQSLDFADGSDKHVYAGVP